MPPISNRVFLTISPHYLQVAVLSGRRLVANEEFPASDKTLIAQFLATHAVKDVDLALFLPAQSFACLLKEDSDGMRNEVDLSAYAQKVQPGLSLPLLTTACDAATGKSIDVAGGAPWLLTSATSASLSGIQEQLAVLGMPSVARAALALPAQIGTVVMALQDMHAATNVAVVALGETDSVITLVSANGVETIRTVPIGYSQIFEAVKKELGLQFRSAAIRLFCSATYDFTDKADSIVALFAPPIKKELEGLPILPSAFHIAGLSGNQAWLGQALSKALSIPVWTPNMATVCAQLSLELPAGSQLTAGTLCLIQHAASCGESAQPPWLPLFLDAKSRLADAATIPAASPPAKAKTETADSAQRPVVADKASLKAASPLKTVAGAAISPREASPLKVKIIPNPGTPKSQPSPSPQPASAALAEIPDKTKKSASLKLVVAGALLMAAAVAALVFFKGAPLTASVATKPFVTEVIPAVSTEVLEAEVKRDAYSFQNGNYRFMVSTQGVLMNLKQSGQSLPLISQLGFMRLYETKPLSDGMRAARKVGDMNSPDYQATVLKTVRNGAVVFEIEVQHPRFNLKQTFTCLPHSVAVHCLFMPSFLSDEQGSLDSVYGIHLNETGLLATEDGNPRIQNGELTYQTKQGELVLDYDQFKKTGSQTVLADPSLVSFVLSSAQDKADALTLDYVVRLP